MKKILPALIISFVLSTSNSIAQMAVDIEPLKGNILATAVTVDATADALPATALTGRKSILVKNNSSTTVYIGSSVVTTLTGIPLLQYDSIILDASEEIVVYGITAAGSADIRVLEIR